MCYTKRYIYRDKQNKNGETSITQAAQKNVYPQVPSIGSVSYYCMSTEYYCPVGLLLSSNCSNKS